MAGSSMRDIKRRMKSVNSMKHITNAMQLVSASKLKKSKAIYDKSQQTLRFVADIIEETFYNTGDVPQLYLQGSREIKRTAYIAITSCRGLCGSFNSNVIRHAQRLIDAHDREEPPLIVAIGSSGRNYFERQGYNIIGEYCLPPEDIGFLATQEISHPLVEMYDRGELDEIVIVSTSYINSLELKVYNKVLLPFKIEGDSSAHQLYKEMDYGPSSQEVFNYLIPKYVKLMIYDAIIESATCEHAARRIAMENATRNANDMILDLNLTYNRTRQASITNEISEIVSGAEALS